MSIIRLRKTLTRAETDSAVWARPENTIIYMALIGELLGSLDRPTHRRPHQTIVKEKPSRLLPEGLIRMLLSVEKSIPRFRAGQFGPATDWNARISLRGPRARMFKGHLIRFYNLGNASLMFRLKAVRSLRHLDRDAVPSYLDMIGFRQGLYGSAHQSPSR
jgi:hypothetical protein